MKHDETNPQDGRLNKTVDCKTHEIGSKSINMEWKWLKTCQNWIKIGFKRIKLVKNWMKREGNGIKLSEIYQNWIK